MIRPVVTSKKLMRVGTQNDGGYLVPADFDDLDIKAVISPGIGQVSDFENYFADLGIPVFLIDKSVNDLPSHHEKFRYFPMFLGPEDNEENHEISLHSIIRQVDEQEKNSHSDLILQMDIEGAEWEVLAAIEKHTLKRFRILVIEFHDFSALFSADFSHRLALSVIEKLLRDFVVVHAHLNNVSRTSRIRSTLVPHTLELTLLRKDRIVHPPQGASPGMVSPFHWAEIPNRKDSPNLPGVRDAQIPDEWISR